MKDLWVQDIMLQNFINNDATRIILLKAFVKDGNLKNVYNRKEILEYIYRTYTDNEEIRKVNPFVVIRNIKHYGLSDIKIVLENALDEWNENAKNHVLKFDDKYIYLFVKEDEIDIITKITKQVTTMLQKKYFDINIPNPKTIDYEICQNDKNIEEFGKSLYRNRVFEDMQYCTLCEETDVENLYAVHILPSEYCSNEEKIDKNNGLLMCKEHAIDYINRQFIFKRNGFVENLGSSIIESYMHLSIDIKNNRRCEFIEKYMEIIKKGI